MIFDRITPWSARLLREGIKQTGLRHSLIAHNVANVDTPGFKRKDVTFDGALKQATVGLVLKGEKPGRSYLKASSMDLVVHEDDRPMLRQDGSNVDIDEEMALLASNAGQYMSYVELHERQMRMVRTAISERLP